MRTLAGELGVAFQYGRGTGKVVANAEAMARNERYGWFRNVCEEHDLAGVMLAHTCDDVAESFLMRAGKGSGLGGLAGMRERTQLDGLTVVRPLLQVRRQALREHLESRKQVWLEDPDNEAGGSQRARVRMLLPALEAAGVTVQGIAASGMALGDADAVVRDVVEAFPLEKKSGTVSWQLAGFTGLPVEVAVRVLARVMGEVLGEGMIVRRGKRVALWQRMKEDATGAATLGGVKFVWRDGMVSGRAE